MPDLYTGTPVRIVDDLGLPVLLGSGGSGGTITLLTAAATTGAGVAWIGGEGFWTAYGTWASATAQLQFSPDAGTTWIDVDGAVLTANGGFSPVPMPAALLRVAISGAVGTPSITSTLARTA